MLTKLQLKTLIGLVLVVFATVLLIQGRTVRASDFYHAFSYVVTVVTVAVVVWERYLWHLWPFQPHLHTRPDLRGTWKGELVSDYREPRTGEQKPPFEVYLVIRQTYSTIDVRLFSHESSSVSLSADLCTDSVGLYTLASIYRNVPTVLRREKSPISHGGFLLNVRGTPTHQLDGEYWTDRNTKGEAIFTSRCKDEAHDFGHAQRFRYRSLTK